MQWRIDFLWVKPLVWQSRDNDSSQHETLAALKSCLCQMHMAKGKESTLKRLFTLSRKVQRAKQDPAVFFSAVLMN